MSAEVFTPPRYGFQSPAARVFPPIVILANTSVCNLRCVHCPQGQGYPDREDYQATFMKWDIFAKAIDEIAEHEIAMLRFASDGESVIHPQFLDQVAYTKAKGIAPLDLTTNAVLLDNPAYENGKRHPGKTIMQRLLELGLDVIDISLDAWTRDKYEKIRVGSDYHRVWANVHRFLYLRDKLKAPTRVMLSIIEQPDSQDEVAKFVEYWTPLVDRVLVRTYQEILGLAPARSGVAAEKAGAIAERWPCPQFWKRVTISPEGDIRFCVADWLSKSAMGNVRTHSIRDIWQNAEYERMRGCQRGGDYAGAHAICGPCTDWVGMRWDWGFEVAINAVRGQAEAPAHPPPLLRV